MRFFSFFYRNFVFTKTTQEGYSLPSIVTVWCVTQGRINCVRPKSVQSEQIRSTDVHNYARRRVAQNSILLRAHESGENKTIETFIFYIVPTSLPRRNVRIYCSTFFFHKTYYVGITVHLEPFTTVRFIHHVPLLIN